MSATAGKQAAATDDDNMLSGRQVEEEELGKRQFLLLLLQQLMYQISPGSRETVERSPKVMIAAATAGDERYSSGVVF